MTTQGRKIVRGYRFDSCYSTIYLFAQSEREAIKNFKASYPSWGVVKNDPSLQFRVSEDKCGKCKGKP